MRNKNLIILFFLVSFRVFSQELLLHYKFDNNFLDSSGNNYHGSPSGVTFVPDRNGNHNSAVYFDGLNDFIDFPNINELKPLLPVSISFWIKYESDAVINRVVFNTSYKEDVNSGIYLTTQSSTGRLAVGYGDGSTNFTINNRRSYLSNNVIKSNEWFQIHIVIISETNMKVYLNCVENGGVYSGNATSFNYSDGPGSLGRHDQNNNSIPSYYFKGVLDDFKYYKGIVEPSINQTIFNSLATTLCKDSSYTLPTTSSNGLTGSWLPSFDSSTVGTTVYTFTPDSNQCGTTFNHSIEITSAVAPVFNSLSTTLCQGTSYTLPTTSSNGLTGSWSPVFDGSTVGTTVYTFTPDSNQCGTTFSHSIEITPAVAPVFNSLSTTLCQGTTYTLPTTSSNGLTGSWSPVFDDSTVGTTIYTFTPDSNQCGTTFSHSIEITPAVAPAFNSLSTTLCQGTSYTLPTTSSNGLTGSWSPVFDSSTVGTTVYTFTPDSNQCAITFNHSIDIKEAIIPTFLNIKKTVILNENYILPEISDNGIIGNWLPPFDSSSIGVTTYLFTPISPGCILSISHKISIIDEIFIPQFFTPNNDNTNDYWKILGLTNYLQVKIHIFDRYGKLLAQLDPNIGWDGNYNGRKMPSTDYWYHLFALNPNNEIISLKGHFSLLR